MSQSLTKQFDALQAGYRQEPYPTRHTRLDRLRRLKSLLTNNEAGFLEALSEDFGYRSHQQSAFADITTTVKSINHACRHLRFWMRAEQRSTDLSLRLSGARCQSEHVPKGVVGIISPWNFPINLALSPLTSVLAAGNRAFIKPSEITPRTSALLEQSIGEYFATDEVQVVNGGIDVAQGFSELPFDHLIYTGAGGVAKSIMKSAAENLVPLTLELGGKSPVVIDRDADLDLAARQVAFGKYFNAGQICIAPDYVLIAENQLDDFLAKLDSAVQHSDSAQGASHAVSIINGRHGDRLKALADNAERHNGKVLQFPTTPAGDYQLTVVINPDDDANICTAEIFGPTLLIRTCESLEAKIDLINRDDHPLVIYYFGKSRSAFDRLARHTRSGAIVHNSVIFQYANDDLPFGGIGASGMGKYRGIDGFREFSNHRARFSAGPIDVSALVSPPYPTFFKTLNTIMRKL